ncbi:MAG TPA: redoxin domain-containing protein [Candidatus Hydrogenedentes bacterium]|nr:redoxin domain-containing protein [Candidatus Hydrogenedentota bacterium]
MKSIAKYVWLVFLFCATVVPLYGCASENAAAVPKIGNPLPNFELKDLNGTVHSLNQYAGNIVVLEMCSIECPWSRGADPHLVALSKKHADDGVVFLGIDSHKSITVDDIKAYAEKAGKSYPILKDVDNKYADAIGAKTTPEVYVVDKEGKLAYHGAFDNRQQETQEGDKSYVANAIAALLDGKAPDPSEAKSWGCSIKRK